MRADLSEMTRLLEKKKGTRGKYWVLNFTIGIKFGGTELEAFVEWYDGVRVSNVPSSELHLIDTPSQGKKCTGNAAVIPDGLE